MSNATPNYKKVLSNLAEYGNIHDVIHAFANTGLYMIAKDFDGDYYTIYFNQNPNASINIIVPNEKLKAYSPKFYLDDDNVLLDIEQALILVLVDRFYFLFNHKSKYYRYLDSDLSGIYRSTLHVEPFAYNNKIKVQNRVRVIKTYQIVKNQKVYYDCIGQAFWDSAIPKSPANVSKYAKLFSDPIAVDKPYKGIYASYSNKQMQAVGFKNTDSEIITIFPIKSNLPERLRQHITSDCCQPVKSEVDYLLGKDTGESVNAICVFLPIESPYDTNSFNPLGEFTLIGGELPISENFAKREFYVRRTFQISSNKCFVLEPGTTVKNGEPIAFDIEGKGIVPDLNYSEITIDEVIKLINGYKVVLKIKAPLEVARLISDYGLKGVTHPRKSLGEIVVPSSLTGKEPIRLPVDMVVGPNSMKSGVNGYKLSYLALKQFIKNEPICVTPDTLSEEEINNLIGPIVPVKWLYKDKVYTVYAGLVTVRVTEMAKDYVSNGVQVLPEVLKIMYNHKSKYINEAAKLLQQKCINEEDLWISGELLKCIPKQSDNTNDNNGKIILTNLVNKRFLPISNVINIESKTKPFFLNPFNNGFTIQNLAGYKIQIPSAKFLSSQVKIFSNYLVFPEYFTALLYLMLSIKNNSPESKIKNNVELYKEALYKELFTKHGSIFNVIAPFVPGGYLKQLISSKVPKGVTVILDEKLNYQTRIFRQQFNIYVKEYFATLIINVLTKLSSFLPDEFKVQLLWALNALEKHKFPVFDIGVRNPVIWRFQFKPKVVWTKDEFCKYLEKNGYSLEEDVVIPSNGSVLRSITDTLLDQADTDGDLYPVTIPFDTDTQLNLLLYYIDQDGNDLKDYELSWTEEYVRGEADNSKLYNFTKEPFKYYRISKAKFAELFSASAIAKYYIGPATVNMWKFHAVAEFMYTQGVFDYDKMMYMQFLYSRIIQDFVIRGIKHVDGGASGYQPFDINNFNEKRAYEELTNFLGVSDADAKLFVEICKTAKEAPEFLSIMRLVNSALGLDPEKHLETYKNLEISKYSNLSYSKILLNSKISQLI